MLGFSGKWFYGPQSTEIASSLFNPSRKSDEVKLIVRLGDTSIGLRRTNYRGLWPVCRICITGLLLQQSCEQQK